MGVLDGGRGALLGVWPVGWLWEAVGFILKTICGMGENRCACEDEGQVGHFQHPMGLGDKFCAHDIINIQHIQRSNITDEQLVQNQVRKYQGSLENMNFLQASLHRFVGQVHYLIFVGASSKNFRRFGAELSELWWRETGILLWNQNCVRLM